VVASSRPGEPPFTDGLQDQVVPEHLLVIVFLLSIVLAATSVLLPGPPLFYSLETVGIVVRVSAMGWLLATRGPCLPG